MKGRIVICNYCGTPADFVDSSVVYHGHSFGMIYLCPRCGAYVGVHKGSDKPLGRLANSELRNWKKAAHAAFDPLWKYGPYRGRRNEAYRWLSEKMGTPIESTHIGMEAMLNFIPAPVAIILMLAGFIALAIGGIRLGYKATVKDLALELVEKAELSIMGSGQGAKKKKQVFAALRAKCPAAIRWAITDEVLDAVIEHAFDVMTAALGKKS